MLKGPHELLTGMLRAALPNSHEQRTRWAETALLVRLEEMDLESVALHGAATGAVLGLITAFFILIV